MDEIDLLAYLDKSFKKAALVRGGVDRKLDAAHVYMKWAIQEGRIQDHETLAILWHEALYGKRPWDQGSQQR